MEVTEEHKTKTRKLIKNGQSIEAIRYLRKELSLDLKTALKLVEAIRSTMDPSEIKEAPRLSKRVSGKLSLLVPGVFSVFGLIMLGVAAYIYSDQSEIISQGNMVTGYVIASPHQPLFEYEYNGDVYQYQSSSSTDPPSYSLGEAVDIYVDTDNPYDIVIDTFTDRWLLIVILGGMGSMFLGISVLVMFVLRAR